MVGRPVISIGYHGKNDALLEEMGLQQNCQYIEHLDVDLLIKQIQAMVKGGEKSLMRIEQKCAEYSQLLDEQYRTILLPNPQ